MTIWTQTLQGCAEVTFPFVGPLQPRHDRCGGQRTVSERVQAGDATIIASVLTEAELLVRPERNGDQEAIQRIGDLLSEPGINVVEVTRRMGRRAASLRSHNRLKLPDAIIVATAIESRCEAIVGSTQTVSTATALVTEPAELVTTIA